MSSSPTVLQRRVAFAMRRLRHAAGLRQGDLVTTAGYSESAVNQLEKRTRRPQRRMIVALLHAYGRADLIPAYEEQLRLMGRKNWWAELIDSHEVTGFDVYLGLEDGASQLESWEPLAIPGLLQSEHYARETLAAGTTGADMLESRLALRQQRQEILTRTEQPVGLWAITTEYALAHIPAAPEVRREQYEHLLDLVALPTVQLQVIPHGVGIGSGVRGPFTILGFDQPEDPGVVYLETEARAIWFETQEDITKYSLLMNRLRACGCSAEQSAALIEQYRKEASDR